MLISFSFIAFKILKYTFFSFVSCVQYSDADADSLRQIFWDRIRYEGTHVRSACKDVHLCHLVHQPRYIDAAAVLPETGSQILGEPHRDLV